MQAFHATRIVAGKPSRRFEAILAGVRVGLETIALEPEMDGATIASVSCYDRHGPFLVQPKIVLDCSGDGDISAKAGVPYGLGDASGNMMAVTISFFMMGVD